MRLAVALVLASAPAFAQAPAPETPAPPVPQSLPTDPQPAPERQPATEIPPEPQPGVEPAVDPAYGERPQRTEPSAGAAPAATYGAPGMRRGSDIIVRFHPDRSRDNITMLAIIAGSGLVAGAVGLYFQLDWRSANEQVRSKRYTGETWTSERQDVYDRAYRSSIIAGVSYGIGGGLLLATAVAYIATEPKLETRVIRPHENGRPLASAQPGRLRALQVGPTRGGAYVGGAWSF